MADQQKLFRKASLERLSSPEQLDQLMQVTTPKGWIALLAICALLFIALVWGIFGRVPTVVQGMGILIRTGGVFDLEAPANGVITDIHINVGDMVKKGEVVAHLAQPDLEDQVEKAKEDLDNLITQQKQNIDFGQKDLKMKLDFYEKQITNEEFKIKSNQQKLVWMEERIKNQEELFEKGLITKQQLLSTKEEKSQTEDAIQLSKNQIKQINVSKNELSQKVDEDALNYKVKVDEARNNLELLQNQYKNQTEIVSSYTGNVLSVLYDEGTQVLKGNALANIELTGKDIKELESVMYVGPTKGKMIQVGMKVQVSPTNVKKEKYGFILGKVKYVSEFPATSQGMMRILKNQDLVKTLAVGGAPYEVEVDLEEDPLTYSGLKWSSGKGPKTKIHTGTVTLGDIITKEERPITLVIPAFKKFLGI